MTDSNAFQDQISWEVYGEGGENTSAWPTQELTAGNCELTLEAEHRETAFSPWSQ